MNRQAHQNTALAEATARLLGITVLLTQLPLLLHLPLWICLPGTLLVLCRVLPQLGKRIKLPSVLMTPLVLIGAASIVLHYGQVFDRDPCVAFLYLLVGFKYLESKTSHDASLLVILSAFLLMTQFFYWQSIAAAMFAIPALFFIALSLFVLQRSRTTDSPRFMVNLTSKLLLQAIPIATLLFVAVPRVTAPGFGDGSGSATTGLSSRMSPGSIASLSLSNEVALRVEFHGNVPAPVDRYWRGPVLSGFDGKEWYILPRAKHPTFAEVPLSPNSNVTPLHYTVTTEPTTNPWLLALDTPSMLPTRIKPDSSKEIIASITEEKQLDSLISLNRAIRYKTASILSDRFISNVHPGTEYLTTTEYNPRAQQLAQEFRHTYQNDAALAAGLLKWFSKEDFHYTLSPPQLGEHAIDDFLFGSRRGFCEHYAGSFVLMLRAAGIPARVVTGYQGGEMNDNYMIIRQSDAHAWAEAYINGRWQRFDPTAAVAPQRVESGFGEALRSERTNVISQLPLLKTLGLQWDKINYQWQSLIIGFDAARQKEIWQKFGLRQPGAVGLVALVIAAVVLWVAVILAPWRMLLGGQKHDACQQQWDKLCRAYARRGIARNTGETAQAYVSRLVDYQPEQKTEFMRLLYAYHSGRFGIGASDSGRHREYASVMRATRRQLAKYR